MAVFADGHRVAGVVGRGVAVLDVDTGRTVYQRADVLDTNAYHRMTSSGGFLVLSGASRALLLDMNASTRPQSGRAFAISRDGRQIAQLGEHLSVARASDPEQVERLVPTRTRFGGGVRFAADGTWLLADLRDGLYRVDIASRTRTLVADESHWGYAVMSRNDVVVATEGAVRRVGDGGTARWETTGLPAGEARLHIDSTETVGLVHHRGELRLIDLQTGAVRGPFPWLGEATFFAGPGLLVGVRQGQGVVAYSESSEAQPVPALAGVEHIRGVDATRLVVSGTDHVGLFDLAEARYVWRRDFAESSSGAQQLEVLEGGGVTFRWSRSRLHWPASAAAPTVQPLDRDPDHEMGDVLFDNAVGRVVVRERGVVLEVDGRQTPLRGVLTVEQLLRAGRRFLVTGEDEEGRPTLFVIDRARGVVHRESLFATETTVYASPRVLVYREVMGPWFIAARNRPTRWRPLPGRLRVAGDGNIIAIQDGRTISVYNAEARPHDIAVPDAIRYVNALNVLDAERVLVQSRALAVVVSATDGQEIVSGEIPSTSPPDRRGLRFVSFTTQGTTVVDLGEGTRQLGPPPGRRQLSADGRHLVGVRGGAVEVMALDGGRTLTLHVVRTSAGGVTVAVSDVTGAVEVIGEEAPPIMVRRGRVENGSMVALDDVTGSGLFARFWQQPDPQ